jgi:hypothetical protein
LMAIRVGRPRKKAMAAGTNVAAFAHVCPSHPRHRCREWGVRCIRMRTLLSARGVARRFRS